MTSTIRYIAYSVLLIFGLVILAILSILAITYYTRRRRAQGEFPRHLYSQYSYITPLDQPPFVIPPYVNEDNIFESGSEEGSGLQDESSADGSLASHSPLGTPTISHPQFERSTSEQLEARYKRERSKPKYRRTLSSYGGSLSPKTLKRTSSAVPPHGKIQASINYVTTKSLLVVQKAIQEFNNYSLCEKTKIREILTVRQQFYINSQVNGMYDLPQLRTSGISTPYVRVNLLSGKDEKDMRTNFMNLSTNRICAFDRISLDQAKESTLKFIVLDYDKFSRSEFVAELTVPLSEINLEEGEIILRKLKSQGLPEVDDALGTLSVSLCQEPREGRLVVHVIKAENLPSSKSEYSLDSYVRVTYLVQSKQIDRKKTKFIKRTVNPVYNEPFIFDMKKEDLTHSSVVCEVFNGEFKPKTTRIGYVHLGTGTNSFGSEIRHWNEMLSSPEKQIVQCHNIHT